MALKVECCLDLCARSELAESIRAELALYVKSKADEILALNNVVRFQSCSLTRFLCTHLCMHDLPDSGLSYLTFPGSAVTPCSLACLAAKV